MKRHIIFVLLIFFALWSCNKSEDGPYTTNVSGFAQKGPFLKGSDVTIIELSENLTPTGKTFFSTIEDNFGYFSMPDVSFESQYIQVKAEGKYYNEVLGGVSAFNEITLYAIASISETSTINANIITHLIQARLLTLINGGMDYSTSKNQAFNELLDIFYIEVSDISSPEALDLTSSDIGGGVLLLISSIIQNSINSGMSFVEYFTTLTSDFKDNGIIDSEIIQRTLGTGGLVLDLDKVIQNLISRYSELGQTINPNAAKDFLENFNNETTFPTIFDSIFPTEYNGSINLICEEDTLFINETTNYSISMNCQSGYGIPNIQVAITSTSDNFTTYGVDWYIDGDTRRYIQDFDDTMLEIPFSFNNSGSLKLELFVLTQSSAGMVEYPEIIIVWM